ncbi:hypothetical protein TrST_g13740 [Triparma strigata]|uniref:K Homology domain-containing protein n=1 Tax=Triparma strigata TaxID=1606541 RepID=A0A9W7BL11_9STRA|nr:hypothetical protein TrST_g13740 [Triparma strigata]
MDQTLLLSKLTARLTTLQNDRSEAQASITAATAQLQSLFKTVPKRPTHSPSLLLSKITALDTRQNTTSLTLNAEKKLLKEKQSFKDSLRLHEKCDQHQLTIDALKSQITDLRLSLPSKESAITELRKSVQKIRLAESLACPFSSLITTTVPCSTPNLSKVIGKGGSNIKKIENTCTVRCDVKGEEEVIEIVGSEESCDKARSLIESITLSETLTIPISPAVSGFLLDKTRSELLKEIREWGVEVRIEKGGLEVRGIPSDLESFKEKFSSLDLIVSYMTLTNPSMGILIGKSGATIKRLSKSSGVQINVSRSKENDNVEVIGKSMDVERCISEIEVLIIEMEVITESEDLPLPIRNLLLLNSGEAIKRIQKTSGCYLKVSGSPKPEASNSKIDYKGLRAEVDSAKSLVLEEIKRYTSSEVIVNVSFDALPAVVGKGGQIVKQLRQAYGVVVDIDFDVGSVKVQSFDGDKRNEAVKAIEEIKRVNHVTLVKVGGTVLPVLLGAPGKGTRAKIMDEMKVRIDVVQESKDVKLRGEKEKVEEAEKVIAAFLEDNYMEVFQLSQEDVGVLVSGKESSINKILSAKHSVEIFLKREQNTLNIRGKKPGVTACLADLKKEIFGSDDIAVTDLKIGDSKGTVIGKGGSQIKEFEKTHSVRIQLLDSTSCIRVRGPPPNVAAALKAVTLLIANQKISVNVPVNESTLKNLGHKGQLTKAILNKNVTPSVKTDSESGDKILRLRGYADDVDEVKRMLDESAGKPLKVKVKMEGETLRKIGDVGMPHWSRIKERCNVKLDIERGDSEGLVVSGKRVGVADALLQVYGYFGFSLSEEFGTFELDASTLARCFTPGDLVIIGDASGVKISKDYTTSQLLLFATSESSEKGSCEERLAKAKDLVSEKIGEWSKMNFVMNVERWCLSVLVGKKGATINGIRDEAGVEIDVDQSSSTVTIKASSSAAQEGEMSGEERINKAKSIIDKLIEDNRVYSEILDLPEDSQGTFIGKGGANIKAIQEGLKDVSFDLIEGGTKVEIKGAEESVVAGRERVEAWREEFEAKNATLEMRVVSVGILVGPKGETIRGLENENGVKIQVLKNDGGDGDSELPNVVIRGERGSVEKVKVLIDAMMVQEEERLDQRRKEWNEQKEREREEYKEKQAKGEEKKKEGEDDDDDDDEEEEGRKTVESQYAAVPVGAGENSSYASTLSKAARKRLNKKNRALVDSSKPLDPGEKGGDLLNFLKSSKDDGRVEGEVIVGAKADIPSMLNSDPVVPPPPGLGFTPNSKEKGKKKKYGGVEKVVENENNDENDSDGDENNYFVSRSGFSVRM